MRSPPEQSWPWQGVGTGESQRPCPCRTAGQPGVSHGPPTFSSPSVLRCVWAPGKGHNSGPVEKQAAEAPTQALQKPLPTALLGEQVAPSRPQRPPGPSQPAPQQSEGGHSGTCTCESAGSECNLRHTWAKQGSRLSGPHPTSPLCPTRYHPPHAAPLQAGVRHTQGGTAGPPGHK